MLPTVVAGANTSMVSRMLILAGLLNPGRICASAEPQRWRRCADDFHFQTKQRLGNTVVQLTRILLRWSLERAPVNG